ncbi:hypothetical protein ACVIHI_008288 [Bradyrhizobium sp. USDA 4524]|nr:hypothetical protein [Bradyrhizobium sp. USDA 4538]MCP1899355.1 hypothetical protein [Bradyrhizobium sp. USDA 4537]MCP1986533.1 hypothetical protein [Bradyrhizobium sp. USDA 4539]
MPEMADGGIGRALRFALENFNNPLGIGYHAEVGNLVS